MTVAVCEPVAAISRCLDNVRETLGGLDDNGIAQTLRDIEKLSPDGPAPREDSSPVTPVRGELWLRDRRDGGLGLEG